MYVIVIFPSFWIPKTRLTLDRVGLGIMGCNEKINLVLASLTLLTGLLVMSLSSNPLRHPVAAITNLCMFLQIGWMCWVVYRHSDDWVADELAKRGQECHFLGEDMMIHEGSQQHRLTYIWKDKLDSDEGFSRGSVQFQEKKIEGAGEAEYYRTPEQIRWNIEPTL